MNALNIAYKNLQRKKIRTVLTIGGVGIAVAVLVSLLGFDAGYQRGLDKDIDKMGYQVLEKRYDGALHVGKMDVRLPEMRDIPATADVEAIAPVSARAVPPAAGTSL